MPFNGLYTLTWHRCHNVDTGAVTPEVKIKKDETKTEKQLKSDNDSIEVGENVMISLNKGSSRGSDAKMKKRKNDCLQNEVQDAKENHAVGEKKKYERKPSQPYCSTCGGNHFEACKGRFCKNCLKNERFIHLAVFS